MSDILKTRKVEEGSLLTNDLTAPRPRQSDPYTARQCQACKVIFYAMRDEIMPSAMCPECHRAIAMRAHPMIGYRR